MRFLISDNQIVSAHPTGDLGEPAGMFWVDGPDLQLDQVYWDGVSVQPRPTSPEPSAYWNPSLNQWILPQSQAVIEVNNWDKLLKKLRSTPIWAKTYEASTKTIKANSAFTVLYGTLTSAHDEADLVWSFAQMREAMAGIAAIGDYTAEEIAQINQWLSDSGFELQLT